MDAVDRGFGWLLAVGGLLHAVGSWKAYAGQPEVLVWSLSASLAALLLAALNLLRVGRRGDRALAWVCAAGCVAWIGVALGFGAAIGHVLDPRALYHAISAAGLAAFSVRSAGRPA
jgi:hypothetical protein